MARLLDLSFIAFAVIFGAIPVLLLAAGIAQRRRPRLREISGSLMISVVTTAVMLGAGEMYFRHFYTGTGGDYRWGNENWRERYWHTNKYGFRDPEWNTPTWLNRTRVWALGDSFTAGWGVNDPADRFADVLAASLGPRYQMVNLGRLGAATMDELKTLKNVRVQRGDVVVFQYYLNDIEPAAGEVFGAWQWPTRTYPLLADESALVGFVYRTWQFNIANPAIVDARSGLKYAAWTYKAYNDPGVWARHEKELNAVIDQVQGAGARLVVVIFPHLTEVALGRPVLDQVAHVFEARGVHDVLKVSDVADWPVRDLVSSARDAHPSAKLQRYVGHQLYERFFAPNAPSANVQPANTPAASASRAR